MTLFSVQNKIIPWNKWDHCYALYLITLLTFIIGISCSSLSQAFVLPQQALHYENVNYGPDAVSRLEAWQVLINSAQESSELEKLQLVTDFFNSLSLIPQAKSSSLASQAWINPVQFLGQGQGSSEDFALAKYLTLKVMGIPPYKMRFAYVVSNITRKPQMVLVYYETTASDPLILDNITRKILYASERPDLRPIYMFNESSIWIPQANAPPKEVFSGDQLLHWKSMIDHMKKTGLTEESLTL